MSIGPPLPAVCLGSANPLRVTLPPASAHELAPALRPSPAARLRATGLPQWLALAGLGTRLLGARLRGGPEKEARQAKALVRTLGRLKGPFAKAGQLAGLRVDLVSPVIREAFASLRSDVPPLPFRLIREAVEHALGESLEVGFARFDEYPIGAASIAQVHRAKLHDGREVAVKVQYPWLAHGLEADLRVLRTALGWGGLALPDDLFQEFAHSIRVELDFRQEAAAAAEIAENLLDDAQVVVPEVIASHSGMRVLTVAWHPTLRLDDGAALDRAGVARNEVLETVARAYARQIFIDGLFHADPHPGNLFVIDEPAASVEPRVLFVDFGLCQRLRPELRRELKSAIFALLQSRTDEFVAAMDRMDMIEPGHREAVRDAVERMTTRMRRDGADVLALSSERVLALKDEAKALLYETPGLRLPADLLLYAKTVTYLFALGAELAPEVDLMKLTVPYLLRFLATRDEDPER